MAVVKARSHRRRSLGFQSKLLIMLLTVSAVSVLVAGAIGYSSGTSSLRDAEFQRLTQLRESRYREMHNYFENISDAATVLTHSAATIDAVKDFGVAFAELQKTRCRPMRPSRCRTTTKTSSARGSRRALAPKRPRTLQTHLQRPDLPAKPLHRAGQRRFSNARSPSSTPMTPAIGPSSTRSISRSSPISWSASRSRTSCCSTPAGISSTPPTRVSTSAPMF